MLNRPEMVLSGHEAHPAPASLSFGSVMNRRRFLAAAIASTFAGTSGTAAGAERGTETEADRKVVLDRLEQIPDGPGFSQAEQRQKAVSLMRFYTAALQREGAMADVSELKRAADLVMSRLYYPQDKVPEIQGKDRSDLPIAAIDLEAALIGHLRLLQQSTAHGPQVSGTLIDRLKRDIFQSTAHGLQTPEILINSLRNDILWYHCYDDFPAVWEHASLRYRTLFLPGDGPVDLRRFADFLKRLPKLHAVSSRAVRDSYGRIGQEFDRRVFSRSSGSGSRQDFLEQWRILITLFQDHLLLEAGNPRSLSKEDAEKFCRWHREHLVVPFMPTVRKLLLRPTTIGERRTIGQFLADGILAEGGLEGVMAQVHAWGLDSGAAITAVSFTSPAGRGKRAEQTGQSSLLFLDVYRGAMGGEQWLSASADERTQLGDPPVRRCMRRNCQPVFLAALQGLSNPGSEGEEREKEVGTFMILAHEGMKGEVSQLQGLPDLAEWGERAGRFLSVQGGRNHALSEEEWLRAKGRQMGTVLVSGFPRSDASGKDAGERVPGVFTLYRERLADDLCRRLGIMNPECRKRVPHSPMLRDERQRDRLAFLEAFRLAAPKLLFGAEDILREWGFSPEEIAAAAQSAQAAVAACEERQ